MLKIDARRRYSFGTRARPTRKASAEVGKGQGDVRKAQGQGVKGRRVNVYIAKNHGSRMSGRVTENQKPTPSELIIGRPRCLHGG